MGEREMQMDIRPETPRADRSSDAISAACRTGRHAHPGWAARFQVTALPDAHVGEATCLRGNSRESAAGDTGCPFGYRVLVKEPA